MNNLVGVLRDQGKYGQAEVPMYSCFPILSSLVLATIVARVAQDKHTYTDLVERRSSHLPPTCRLHTKYTEHVGCSKACSERKRFPSPIQS